MRLWPRLSFEMQRALLAAAYAYKLDVHGEARHDQA
jgi:hypothetical protein